MNNYMVSLIRTWVPVGVGAVLTWLLSLGISISADQRAGLVAASTAVLTGAYYAIVRGLERKWPMVGTILLGFGAKAKPDYVKPEVKA